MKIKIQPGLDHITDRADLLQDFVVFVCKDLQCMPCPIDIVNGREDAGLKTTAQYDTQNHHVTVNAKNRHFGDVLRSIAHELVHHKQNLNGELDAPVQDVGGDIEDEANARAGALLKSFAYRKGPERIYESRQHRSLHEDASEQLTRGLRNFNNKMPRVMPTGAEARARMRRLRKKAGILTPTEKIKKYASEKYSDAKRYASDTFDSIADRGREYRSRVKGAAPQQVFPSGRIGSKTRLAAILQQNKLDDWTKLNHPPVIFRGAPLSTSFQGNPSIEFEAQAAPVYSIGEGVVQEIGNSSGQGNYIKIMHVSKAKEAQKPGEDPVPARLYRSSYYFMGRRLPKIKPGATVEEGETLGYANSLLDPESDRDENQNFQFTFEFLGSKNPGEKKWSQDGRFLNPLNPQPLREQDEGDMLADLKRSFVQNVFRVVTPLKSMAVTSAAGKRNLTGKTEAHGGIDYKAAIGTPLRNPMLSIVRSVGKSGKNYDARKFKGSDLTGKQKSGNYVTVEPVFQWPDGNQRRFSFVHMDQVDVSPGQILLPGDIIGTTGNTGRTTGPHLHLTPKKSRTRGDIYLSFDEVEQDVKRLQQQFSSVMNNDEEFLELFSTVIPKKYSGIQGMALSEHTDSELVQTYINELITAYGLGRIDPTQGGVGKMFKLGVDYKNASTNIPHVGQGYVDRSHALPYEITVRSNLDPKEIFNTLFREDFSTDYVIVVPDQVSYTDDGFRLQASVSTGSNEGDEDDVNRISTELYKAVQGFPSTPKDANFVIDVHPVVDKIKYFV